MRRFADRSLKEPIAIIGPCISILGYFSPVGAIKAALLSGNSTDLPVPIFISQLALCVVSTAYGLGISDAPIYLTNGIGAILQVAWIIVWYYIAWVNKKVTHHPGVILMFSGAVLLSLIAAISRIPSDAVGTITVMLSVTLSFSPLAQIPRVVKSRKTMALPVSMSAMMLLGNIVWGIYGWIEANQVIAIPCLLGYELAIFQLLVSAWCMQLLPYELSFLEHIVDVGSDAEGRELLDSSGPIPRRLVVE